jgi:hypothetical protein
MKPLCSLLSLLLVAARVHGDDLYHIRHLSERYLIRTYTGLLLHACRHADKVWQDSANDPHAGYWGTGRSDQMNEGIRAVAGMLLATAAVVKHSDSLDSAERHTRLRQATRAIHYAVSTHRTGTEKCTDGKPWGGSWQSAMWTATLGFGAWLIWDDLDPALRQEVERVVASEADRFLGTKPPAGRQGDTKAEENGWNMVCLAVAANLLPTHPHAADWQEKAIEYMMNTLSVPQDAQDKRMVDGRPVSEWFAGANLHPDYTLENHNIFHPSYMACSSYFMTQAAMYYTYARRPVPQAATHHLLDTWKMFRTIILPSGEAAYPQGMDWELHGLPYINLYASLGSYQKDALAACREQAILQYMRAWQTMRQGDLAVPGSRLGFTRHAICAEQAAYALLAHKIFGPAATAMSESKAAAQLRGVWEHPFTGFTAHRTDSKFFSFSWKNRIMGLLMPVGAGHDGDPFFSVPITTGFVGSFELSPKGDPDIKVVEHTWRETSNGFETTGSLLLNGGRLQQTLRVTSVGKQTVVYQDRVTALTNLSLSRELGVPLGIENDEVTGGKRVVHHCEGTNTFEWSPTVGASVPAGPNISADEPKSGLARTLALPGTWANVDGRLGVVMVIGSGLTYHQAAGYDPHTAVCPDILYASCSDHPREFKAGELVARRIVLFFVEVTPQKTKTLAQCFRLEEKSHPPVLWIKLPEGGETRLPLL